MLAHVTSKKESLSDWTLRGVSRGRLCIGIIRGAVETRGMNGDWEGFQHRRAHLEQVTG